jgi:hypothetical protein
MQGYENGFYVGGRVFDNVTKYMRIYKEEISDRCSRWCVPTTRRRRWHSRPITTTATALRSSPARATLRINFAAKVNVAMNVPIAY